MKVHTKILGGLAIAGVAFTAGQMNWFGYAAPLASAEPLVQEGYDLPPEVAARMEAWEKAAQPGKHHKVLEQLLGDWEGSFRIRMAPDMDPMEVTGTIKREWILDGHYIKETVHGDAVGDMPAFKGLGFLGYNNIDGQYEIAWMENHSTAIAFETAWYDADEKIMHFSGTHREPSGKVFHTWGKLDLSSPGQHSYTGWMLGSDGRRFKSFEAERQRKTGR